MCKRDFLGRWGGAFLMVSIVEAIFLLKVGFSQFHKKHIAANERKDYWALMGWQNTMEKLGFDADVCFFGNSITYYSQFQKSFSDLKIVNLGYPGDGLEGMLVRYKTISFVNAEKIFIMAGINDLNSQVSIDDLGKKYESLIDSVIVTNPESQIYIESILPVNHNKASVSLTSNEQIQKANLMIRRIAEERNLIFIDLYKLYADDHNELPSEYTEDGVHLTPSAYKRWEEGIKEYLYK